MSRPTWKSIFQCAYAFLETNKEDLMDEYHLRRYNPTDLANEFISGIKRLHKLNNMLSQGMRDNLTAREIFNNLDAHLTNWLASRLPESEVNTKASTESIYEVWIKFNKIEKLLALYLNASKWNATAKPEIRKVKYEFEKLAENKARFKTDHLVELNYMDLKDSVNKQAGQAEALKVFHSTKIKSPKELKEELYLAVKELKEAYVSYNQWV